VELPSALLSISLRTCAAERRSAPTAGGPRNPLYRPALKCAMSGGRALQFLPIPLAEVGARVIRRLQKLEQRSAWRRRPAYIVIHQKIFFKRGRVERRLRSYRVI